MSRSLLLNGTGLDLEIARRFVIDGHNGEISVEPKPGETQFAVRLPIT